MNAVAEIKTSADFNLAHIFKPEEGFYVVTYSGSVYKVLFKRDIDGPLVFKVASKNPESKVKLGERLMGGEFLEITGERLKENLLDLMAVSAY